MVGTFLVLRASLYFSPDSDFNVGSYNIHHLFTGLLLAALGGIPLALFSGGGRLRWAALVIFGVGLAMALDEWVYLIVTEQVHIHLGKDIYGDSLKCRNCGHEWTVDREYFFGAE